MKRADPADLRAALEIANALMKAGIDFVPTPVLSDEDKAILARDVQIRLEQIEKETSNGK